MLRDWGAERKYEHVLKGFNYRMEAIQGAILRVKLRCLEQWTQARIAHAAAYGQHLIDTPLILPTATAAGRHVYHIYAVLTDRRAALMDALNARGIQTGIHYPYPVHLLPAYADLGYQAGDFPISEQIGAQELSLPMYPELTEAHISAVAEAVTEFHTAEAGTHLTAAV
jgi:dTDP-4-amino-4,6-dideoxygalactose transaminase